MPAREELKNEAFRRAHGKPCRILLRSGQTVTVDRFEMIRTYIGLIDGIPPKEHIDSRIRDAEAYVSDNWKGPRTVVVPPDICAAGTDHPVLPTLTMMAQLSCAEPRNKGEHGSWLNLVWFADIDDQKSIKGFAETALENVDWQEEADSFLF